MPIIKERPLYSVSYWLGDIIIIHNLQLRIHSISIGVYEIHIAIKAQFPFNY